MGELFIRKKPHKVRGKRLLLGIGKSVSKKAVTRNLLKRRVRVLMRPITLKNPEWDYTVVINPGAEKLPFSVLKKIIETHG